jgi:LacI family transcriptional regulator
MVGFDDFDLADLLEPGITVVAQNPKRIGALAAERLFARIDGDDQAERTYVVPTTLIPRGSGEIVPSE